MDAALDIFAYHRVDVIIGSIAAGIFFSVLVNPTGAEGLPSATMT